MMDEVWKVVMNMSGAAVWSICYVLNCALGLNEAKCQSCQSNSEMVQNWESGCKTPVAQGNLH